MNPSKARAPAAGHGGRRERFALLEQSMGSDQATPPRNSSLADHLLRQWAWGAISSNNVQQISMHAYDDQIALLRSMQMSEDRVCPKLQALARLGQWGQQPGNVQSQLLNWLGAPRTPPAMTHKVPVLVPKKHSSSAHGSAIVDIELPFLLPHEMFAWMYDNDRDRFNQLFLGQCPSTTDIKGFWKEMTKRGDPRLLGHPMLKRANWDSRAIPLSLHGDAVPVLQVGKNGPKAFDVYSIQSLFATGTTLTVKLMLFGVWTVIATDSTWEEIWRIITWSLHWLYAGVWPPVDWNGDSWDDTRPSERSLANQPLAGGYFGVLYALKGDADYFAKSLKLHHYNSNALCDLCPATRRIADRSLLYNNFDRDAVGQRSLYDAQTWRALYDGKFLHWLFNLTGVNNLMLEPDELHVMHLGVTQYLLGSVLHILVFSVVEGQPDRAMEAVWKMVCRYYKDEHPDCQYTNLTINSFCNKEKPFAGFPRLKGKGAEVKDLLPGICKIWREVARGHPQYEAINEVVTALCDVQQTLRAHARDMFLPQAAVDTLQTRIDDFLIGYQSLAAAAEASGELLWSNPSKFHSLWHLGDKGRYLNPRRTNCFVDEDFVGQIKGLVHSCAAGTELHAMIGKAMEKYRWGLHFLSLDHA